MFYKVKANDTLSKLAEMFAIPSGILLAFNQPINGSQTIYPGQILKVPNLEDIPTSANLATGISADALIERARSAVSKGIRYKLGKGGVTPTAKLPDEAKKCDCSGFVCWILSISRKTDHPFYKKYGGWIYTDSMEADINNEAGIFERLTVPIPGCIVVYGAGAKIGHVGLVSEVVDGKMKKVIHCSSGNDEKFNDSIQETTPAVFDRADALWGKFANII